MTAPPSADEVAARVDMHIARLHAGADRMARKMGARWVPDPIATAAFREREINHLIGDPHGC